MSSTGCVACTSGSIGSSSVSSGLLERVLRKAVRHHREAVLAAHHLCLIASSHTHLLQELLVTQRLCLRHRTPALWTALLLRRHTVLVVRVSAEEVQHRQLQRQPAAHATRLVEGEHAVFQCGNVLLQCLAF